MLKKILLSTLFVLFSTYMFSQNTINFEIDHKLGDVDFEVGLGVQNNIGHDFNVSRLQYYVSEISLTHDGGQTTSINDTWILVDATEPTLVNLGSHNINVVEKINFHIGVNPEVNHDDPSTYPSGHPLAPQSPSMHWGWSSGYRFVAYEGMGSSNYNQIFELHGLGDINYFTTEVNVNASANPNNEVLITLNADYIRGLEGTSLNSGNIVHGEGGDAARVLENFRDYVFTESLLATNDFNDNSFIIYPNPTNTGNVIISSKNNMGSNLNLKVYDVLGREILNKKITSNNFEFQLPRNGIYIAKINDGNLVETIKLISK